MKPFLFGAIVTIVLGITGYLIWSTISTNIKSKTGGPVHWHADFEIWNCGEKIDIIDPKGWDNKVGTPLFHEHSDGRIHVEGPVMDYSEISLGQFFRVIGGELASSSLSTPVNNGLVIMENGTKCGGETGEVQVLVYKTEGKTFFQEKLVDPASYILSPHSKVPPGDCIIIEFDKKKDKTDKICNFYEVAIQKGEILEQSRE